MGRKESLSDKLFRLILEKAYKLVKVMENHALNPIIYDEQDFSYHAVGEKCGDAFKMGAALKKKLKKD